MRELAFGPRASGRTTRLAQEIVKDLNCHSRKVYVIAAKYYIADMVRNIIRDLGGDRSRIIPMGIDSLNIAASAVDPLDIYFEHTAYEFASSRQLIQIYDIEDSRARIIWGAP